MQHETLENTVNSTPTPLAMPGEHAGYGSGGGGSGRHDYDQQRRHPNGSVSPPPPAQEGSSPALAAKPQLLPQPLHRGVQPSQPGRMPHGHGLAPPDQGSPTTYKVSPITRENSTDPALFNPQSPYRSMAPSHSQFFHSSGLTSPNDPFSRDMRPEALAAAAAAAGGSSSSSSSPLHYRRPFASSQSSSSLHSPETPQGSQQNGHPPHPIPASDSGHGLSGGSAEAVQTPTTAESCFTAVHANTNAASSGAGSCPGRSPPGAGVVSPSPLSPGPRVYSAAQRSGDDASTIAVRRQSDTIPLNVNTSLEGQGTPAASVGARQQQQQQQQQHGPTSPLHGSTPLTETSPAGGRWVSPHAPDQAESADASDGFQSPGTAPSSYEGPNAGATGTAAAPSLAPQVRSPAMYGVIGLPYTRGGEAAAASPAVGSGRPGGQPVVVSPVTQFHPVPASASRAPTIIKLRAPPSAQQQQPEGGGGGGGVSSLSTAVTASHVDPASSTAAAVTAHPRSGSSEFSARYRRSIARNAQGGSAVAPRETSASDSRDASSADGAAKASCSDAPAASDSFAGQPRRDSRAGGSSADQTKGEGEPEPQHITSVSPAEVVAARARAPASGTTPAATAAEGAARQQQLRRQANAPSSITGGLGQPHQQQQKQAALTADTVLPVVAREDEVLYSSTTTDTTDRSNSSSRRAGTATSPTSSKSSVRAGLSAQSSSQDNARLAHSTSGLSGSSGRLRERARPQPQPPHRKPALSATYSGTPSSARAAAVAQQQQPAAPSSLERTRRPSSVSSSKPAAPLFAGYNFAASRSFLQRYIDQWRDRFEEDKTAYKEGGYLTVTPGKIVHARYVLIQKLGWGEFSTVWLAYDTKHATLGRGATQAFVAVKVAKCRASVQEATHYEVSLLRYIEARLPPHAMVTNIVDCFEVQGEFGLHTCMVMPLCGPNLLAIIDRIKGQRGRRGADDVRLVKEILISVLLSLHELSVLNVVHTDIKPENVLCCAVDAKLVASMEKFCSYNKDRSHMISVEAFREAVAQQSSDHLVCLADFGLSALLEPPGTAATWATSCPDLKPSTLAPLMRCKKNFNVTRPGVMDNLRGTLIQTREYRAPEVLLGLDFTCTTDVWSVGCMAFELITGSFLMDPKKKTRDTREMDVEHLAMMMQLIGPLPAEITNLRVQNNDYYDAIVSGAPVPRRGDRQPPEYLHRFVDRDGNFIYAARYRAYRQRSLEMELEPYLGFREARLAASFILSCLCSYDPRHRPSAKKMLGHPWFQGMMPASKDRGTSK